ncbi:MAG: T9SS type A sorting domain-containing protein [Ignavibacteria bacterium]|nr:T9SS type A sorting domain-containing protein [Ignavibacteria bacterium]
MLSNFIKTSVIILLFASLQVLKSECLIKLRIENENSLYAGERIVLKHINNYPLTENINIFIDDTIQIFVFELRDRILTFRLPSYLTEERHKIFIYEKLYEDCAEVYFSVKNKPNKSDTINPYDPDPRTNLGKEVDYSKGKPPVPKGEVVKNKPGGSSNNKIEDCDKFHKIDGIFTDSVGDGKTKEWSTITPLIGTFSNLYLDYCPTTKILYIMNDWKLGNGNYDSLTCFNEFEFSTAGGVENWKIRIYNSITKGIKVTLNGKDVTNDTNYVLGGRYGNAKSLLVDSNHTMWEFGVKASGGLFTMRLFRDEVGMIEVKPSVTLYCDEDGYGTISEPNIIVGSIDKNGSEMQISKRYIPLSGVAGLLTEPYSFGGTLKKDTLTIYSSKDNKRIKNICINNHKIDGKFTNEPGYLDEWMNSEPAEGMFSNLYAEYCSGKLYILNDWKIGYEEPDKQNCYNLFELFTANGKEHWGIYVYNDNKKKPIVYKNGVDVSNDTSIVEDGKYGFGKSPKIDYEHTIYEFAINAGEGDWHLYLCDPGPSSFCDGDARLPRKYKEYIKFSSSTGNTELTDAFYNDTINLDIMYDDIDFLYANKFAFYINYDYKLFFPLLENILENNKGKFDRFSVRKIDKGLIELEGYSDKIAFTDSLLINISGIVLAGYDNKSTLSGKLLIGNKSRYMKEFEIKPIKISAQSKCPLTNSLIFDNYFSIIDFYPNPSETIISFNILSKYESKLNFEIIDYRGVPLIKTNNNNVNSGINEYTLNVANLLPGVYLLKISDGINLSFHKFIKR